MELPEPPKYKKKGFNWRIIIFLVILVFGVFLLFILPTLVNQTSEPITNETCAMLPDVTFFYSETCPHCLKMMPIVAGVEQDLLLRGINKTFMYINIYNDKEVMKKLNYVPYAIPTLVIRCQIYTGTLTKEELIELIK